MTDHVEVLATGGGTQLAPEAPDPFNESDSGPWPIHGIAMPEDKVLTGGSLTPTLWTADVLREATSKLDGQDIVTDQKHDPDDKPGVREVIGAVTATEYLSGHGIGYNGEIDDRSIAQKIARGRLDASPYLYRTLTDEKRDVDGTEATIPEEILSFDNLAVVRNGAGGDDVAIQAGTHPDLGSEAAEALAEAFPHEPRQRDDGPCQSSGGNNYDPPSNTDMSDTQDPDPDKTVEQLSDENRQLRRRVQELELEHREIKGGLAEALAEQSPFDAGELEEKFSYKEMRARFDDGDVVETLTPAPRTRDPDPTGETQGSGGAETLSADEEQELDTLRQRREVLADFATEDRLDEIDDKIETLAGGEQQ